MSDLPSPSTLKISPLPWRLDSEMIVDADGSLVAEFEPSPTDSAFVVRSVNAHHPLVEALVECRRALLAEYYQIFGEAAAEKHPTIKAADDVLASLEQDAQK